MSTPEGHRQRLRQSFQTDPASLSELQRLELLLTYIIPRRDVTPLAEDLLSRFGNVENILMAPNDELVGIPGIGESTQMFFQLLHYIFTDDDMRPARIDRSTGQLALFNLKNEEKKSDSVTPGPKPRQMRVFANDEIANSLEFLPQASGFQTLEAFKQYLNDKLPYNAAETRLRRTSYILDRFYPEGNIDNPLTFFSAYCSSLADLKPVVFYHILKAEPIAAKVAEEFIWPALPIGRVEREQMREFVLRYLPDAGNSSQKNMLRALSYTYDLLGVGSTQDTSLRFQLQQGSLESLLYILTSEYPKPGIYSFDSLFNSPIHRWMLWDRQWLRNQLYNLQDFGILSKISEIDTVRQFTLAVDQPTALRQFFEHPARNNMAIRETTKGQSADQGD